MRTKNYIDNEAEWFTISQLRRKKLAPIDPSKKERMWNNGYHERAFEYYHISNTRPSTKDDYAEEKAKERERSKKYREKVANKQIKLIQELEKEIQQQDELLSHYREKSVELAKMLCQKALEKEIKKFEGCRTIVIDTETTGLESSDEILQLSIIDADENVIIDKKYKPIYTKSWNESEKIHGISKEDVANCSFILDDLTYIQAVINNAETIIGYNTIFDIKKLKNVGIVFDDTKKYVDVMIDFAKIYGEWNEYRGDYKWQKLTKCASYYKYEFKAHDSLEDCKATLFCWKKMKNGV